MKRNEMKRNEMKRKETIRIEKKEGKENDDMKIIPMIT